MKLSRIGLRRLIESVVNEQKEFKPNYTDTDALLMSELHSALTPAPQGLIGLQKKFIELRNDYREADSKRSSLDYLNPRSEVALKPKELFKKMEAAEKDYDALAKTVEKMYRENSESDLFKDSKGNKIELDFNKLTAFKYFGAKDGASAFKKFGDFTTAKTHVEQVFKNCDEFETHYSGFVP